MTKKAATAASKLKAIHEQKALRTAPSCEACSSQEASIRGLLKKPQPATPKILLLTDHIDQLSYKLGYRYGSSTEELLYRVLTAADINIAEDCYLTSISVCTPASAQVRKDGLQHSCIARLLELITKLKPHMIVTFGSSTQQALHNLMSSRDSPPTPVCSGLSWLSTERVRCYHLSTLHLKLALQGTAAHFETLCMDIQRIKRILEKFARDPAHTFEPFEPRYSVISSVGAVEGALQRAYSLAESSSQYPVSCDIETTGFDFQRDEILSIGFSFAEGEATIFDRKLCAHAEFQKKLRSFFQDPRFAFIFHNAQFDTKFLDRMLKINVPVTHDTLLMHYCIDERQGTHGLKTLLTHYLDVPDYAGDMKQYLPSKSSSFADLPVDVLHKYHAFDCDGTRRLYFELLPLLEAEATKDVYQKLLIPATNVFSQAEAHGVLIDQDRLNELENEFGAQQIELEEQIHKHAIEAGLDLDRLPKPKKGMSRRFNPGSPKQVAHVIYDLLGVPAVGKRTTNAEFLDSIQTVYPFVEALKKYRRVAKLYNTYIKSTRQRLGLDGRIHASFRLYGTVTGRLASRDPNLQNIPARSVIKDMFIPSPGHTFVESDYSQLELRVAAYLTGEVALMEAFQEGFDIHTNVASKILGKPPSEISSHERSSLKEVTFGILYGRRAPSLAAKELSCTVEVAQQYIDKYFARLPTLHRWIQAKHQEIFSKGYVTSTHGRRRRFWYLHPLVHNRIKRQAVNMPIQAMASDMCLISFVKLHHELIRLELGRVLFTVHDAIMCELKTERLDEALAVLRQVMENPALPKKATFPWTVNIKAGSSWGATEEVKA